MRLVIYNYVDVKRLLFLVLLLTALPAKAQESKDSLKWFKGNTHTHSTGAMAMTSPK